MKPNSILNTDQYTKVIIKREEDDTVVVVITEDDINLHQGVSPSALLITINLLVGADHVRDCPFELSGHLYCGLLIRFFDCD